MALNFPEWEARQKDMHSREDFARAPYGPGDPDWLPTYSHPSEVSVEDDSPLDLEYEDDDRDYIDELNALGHGPIYLAEDFDS